MKGDSMRILVTGITGYVGGALAPRLLAEGVANGFAAREERSAVNFAEAAVRAGVGRIVYLGGPVPRDAPVSPHLASRLRVEEILLGLPNSVALRASVVIGARSRSFRFLVRLVERMPVLP